MYYFDIKHSIIWRNDIELFLWQDLKIWPKHICENSYIFS